MRLALKRGLLSALTIFGWFLANALLIGGDFATNLAELGKWTAVDWGGLGQVVFWTFVVGFANGLMKVHVGLLILGLFLSLLVFIVVTTAAIFGFGREFGDAFNYVFPAVLIPIALLPSILVWIVRLASRPSSSV